MRNITKKPQTKHLFVFLSLVLITLTITLTVIQTRQTQDLRSSAASTLKDCTVGGDSISNNDDEKKLRTLINDYRKEKNLTALSFHEDLNRAAAWKSDDMTTTQDIDHEDSVGRDFPVRIKDCGYDWEKALENLASYKPQDTQKVFDAWKGSDTHNKNMLCKDCVHIGLATVKANNGTFYWTMTAGILKSEDTQDDPEEEEAVDEEVPTDEEEEVMDEDLEEEIEEEPIVTLPPAPQTLPEGTTGMLLTSEITGIGSTGNTDPLHVTRPVTVTIGRNTTQVMASVSGSVTFNPTKNTFTGAIALPDSVINGNYIIKVKTDYSLTQTVSSGFFALTKGKTTVLPEIVLSPVDLNQDNVISFLDVLKFRTCFRDQSCTEGESDLNDDGEIDILDLNVFNSVFGNTRGD